MRRTGWGPWAGLRQPWQTDADAWGAASKPCWGENTTAVSKPLRPARSTPAFPAAFEAGHRGRVWGLPDVPSLCGGPCLGMHPQPSLPTHVCTQCSNGCLTIQG